MGLSVETCHPPMARMLTHANNIPLRSLGVLMDLLERATVLSLVSLMQGCTNLEASGCHLPQHIKSACVREPETHLEESKAERWKELPGLLWTSAFPWPPSTLTPPCLIPRTCFHLHQPGKSSVTCSWMNNHKPSSLKLFRQPMDFPLISSCTEQQARCLKWGFGCFSLKVLFLSESPLEFFILESLLLLTRYEEI